MTFYIIRCYYKDEDDREKYYDLQSINGEVYIKLNNSESILYKDVDIKFNQPYNHIVSMVTDNKIKPIKEDAYTDEIRDILVKIKNIEETYLYSRDNMRKNYTDDDFGVYVGKAIKTNQIIEGYLYKGADEQFTITEKGGTMEYPVYANSIYSKKEIVEEIGKPYPFISLEQYLRMVLYAPSSDKRYVFVDSKDSSKFIERQMDDLIKLLDYPTHFIENKCMHEFKVNGIRDIYSGSTFWDNVHMGLSKKELKDEDCYCHTMIYIDELSEKEKILLSMYPELLDTKRDEIFKSFWGENKYKSQDTISEYGFSSLDAIFSQNISKEEKITKNLKQQKNNNKADYSFFNSDTRQINLNW